MFVALGLKIVDQCRIGLTVNEKAPSAGKSLFRVSQCYSEWRRCQEHTWEGAKSPCRRPLITEPYFIEETGNQRITRLTALSPYNLQFCYCLLHALATSIGVWRIERATFWYLIHRDRISDFEGIEFRPGCRWKLKSSSTPSSGHLPKLAHQYDLQMFANLTLSSHPGF